MDVFNDYHLCFNPAIVLEQVWEFELAKNLKDLQSCLWHIKDYIHCNYWADVHTEAFNSNAQDTKLLIINVKYVSKQLFKKYYYYTDDLK